MPKNTLYIPVDYLAAQVAHTLGRCLLIREAVDGDVQVHPRPLLHGRSGQLQSKHRAGSITAFERAPARASVYVRRLKVEQRAPELDGKVEIVNAEDWELDRRHMDHCHTDRFEWPFEIVRHAGANQDDPRDSARRACY